MLNPIGLNRAWNVTIGGWSNSCACPELLRRRWENQRGGWSLAVSPLQCAIGAAVEIIASMTRLKTTQKRSYPMRRRRVFTEAEDDYIRTHRADHSIGWIAERLDRCAASV